MSERPFWFVLLVGVNMGVMASILISHTVGIQWLSFLGAMSSAAMFIGIRRLTYPAHHPEIQRSE